MIDYCFYKFYKISKVVFTETLKNLK
jgi:hypothetical protein